MIYIKNCGEYRYSVMENGKPLLCNVFWNRNGQPEVDYNSPMLFSYSNAKNIYRKCISGFIWDNLTT
jgi:hypothetical protein